MRVVFDTNVVLSALLFPSGSLAWLRDAWHDGRLTPLVSNETVIELIRVLGYPKFELSEEERLDLMADYLPFAEAVEVEAADPVDTVCRDAYDQKFITLALAAGADALLTGDRDLLDIGAELPFPVLTATDLATRL